MQQQQHDFQQAYRRRMLSDCSLGSGGSWTIQISSSAMHTSHNADQERSQSVLIIRMESEQCQLARMGRCAAAGTKQIMFGSSESTFGAPAAVSQGRQPICEQQQQW